MTFTQETRRWLSRLTEDQERSLDGTAQWTGDNHLTKGISSPCCHPTQWIPMVFSRISHGFLRVYLIGILVYRTHIPHLFSTSPTHHPLNNITTSTWRRGWDSSARLLAGSVSSDFWCFRRWKFSTDFCHDKPLWLWTCGLFRGIKRALYMLYDIN